MREILFRGKSIVNNMWVYGDLITVSKNDFAIRNRKENTIQKVNFNTIGQYVGLKDICGLKIFEGDIVESKTSTKGIVMYKDEYACFVVNELDVVGYEFDLPLVDCMEDLEVVGNIHEVTP